MHAEGRTRQQVIDADDRKLSDRFALEYHASTQAPGDGITSRPIFRRVALDSMRPDPYPSVPAPA